MNVPTEHQEQCDLVKWFGLAYPAYAPLLYAIPNGSNKSVVAAMKFKREGLRKGFPDLGLALARRGFHGLFIEMKRLKGSKTSPEQAAYVELLNDNDYSVSICRGYDEAVEKISWYMQ